MADNLVRTAFEANNCIARLLDKSITMLKMGPAYA